MVSSRWGAPSVAFRADTPVDPYTLIVIAEMPAPKVASRL